MPVYLWLDIITLSFPLFLSFDRKVRFVRKWKFFFPAMILTAGIFLMWDALFTYWGIWSFNEYYLVGIKLGNMPLEEWLFFFVVPFACVFVYEALNTYFPKDHFAKLAPFISAAIVFFLVAIALLSLSRVYTLVTFLGTAVFIAYLQWVGKAWYMGYFYRAYLVHLIPFAIFNGILTALPVVMYNDQENLGIRLYTIPIEDTVYSMLKLLMNISIFEYLQSKWGSTQNR